MILHGYNTLGSRSSIVSWPDPTSHEEKGLVSIERFLGCAESIALILDKPMK